MNFKGFFVLTEMLRFFDPRAIYLKAARTLHSCVYIGRSQVVNFNYFFALVGTSGTLYHEFEYFATPSPATPPPSSYLTPDPYPNHTYRMYQMPRHVLIQATSNTRCDEGCQSSHISFRKATRRWKSRYRKLQ